jgi:hypothetical protein
MSFKYLGNCILIKRFFFIIIIIIIKDVYPVSTPFMFRFFLTASFP